MEALGEEWITLVGRLVFYAGWVEHSLGELSVLHAVDGLESSDTGWGLSGKRLIDRLKQIEDHDGQLSEAIDGYEGLAFLRNKVIHSGITSSSGSMITAWHAPISKGKPSLRSYTLTVEQLEEQVASWRRLSEYVDSLIATVMDAE